MTTSAGDGDRRAIRSTLAAAYDTAAPVTGAQVTELPPPTGIGVTATRYDPGHMTFRLDKPAPDGRRSSCRRTTIPVGSATVDGKPAPSARVDYTLIGVPLPAGATTVDLVFTHRRRSGDGRSRCAAPARALVGGGSRLWAPTPWLNARSSSFRPTTSAPTFDG